MQTFQELLIPSAVSRALEEMKFSTPTPIQKQAIPIAISGKDLIGCAQTGTGKTAAFCIPLAARLLETSDATALVIAPTRELAQQIEAHWNRLARFTNIKCALVIGGASMSVQIKTLKQRPRLVIATPGRLVDHIKRRTVELSGTKFLVLDEADRMLDMGFAPQLNEIMRALPKQRQTMMFSATWASELDQLSRKYLVNPNRITVGKMNQAASKVTQGVVMTSQKDKNETLLDELNRRSGSIIVFARTQHRTDRVARYLASYGVSVGRIHGGRSQGQRNAALSGFRKGEIRVLVATDIAARGIDVKDIAHVINYDLPQCNEDYVHRIGRTGRAGTAGEAVSFITPEDRAKWRTLACYLKKTGSSLPA